MLCSIAKPNVHGGTVPYSSDHQFLFLHIPKNAGKSVEIALGLVSAREARSYRWRTTLNRAFTWAQRKTADTKVRTRLWGVVDHTLMAQHLTYAEVYLLGLLSPSELECCAKVAVCRNPYDRAVSLFFHLCPFAPRTPEAFEEFLRSWTNGDQEVHGLLPFRRPQWEYCVDLRGELVLDVVLRYESLDTDVRAFATHRLGESVEVPWIGRQRESRDYANLYTRYSRELVRDAYGYDFELFGYSP